MPELPDLQVISRNLDKKISGKTVEKITLVNAKRTKDTPAAFRKAAEGQAITKVYREGKELRLQFANGRVLGLHLMLHGQLAFFDKKNEHKHTIIEWLFDDQTGLALTDYQGLATPTLDPQESEAPDALSKSLTASFLEKKLSATRATIKSLLTDQHIIRGIGNAYADEILWHARISPFSVCNKIPPNKIKDLLRSIRTVLEHAEKEIRKEHPGIISGEIRDFLAIHQPRKTHSPTGAPILHKKAGGGKTYYTEEQELFS